jgi:hypothetical protein
VVFGGLGSRDPEESLEEKLAYVRNNPVRRGLVKNPEQYQWFWEAPS